MSSSSDIQKELDAEKRKARVWMIIAIVAMVIGVAMIVVAVIIAIQKKSCPQCESAIELCAVSRDELKRLGAAKSVIKAYDDKLKELVNQGAGLRELEIFGKVQSSSGKSVDAPGFYFGDKKLNPKWTK